MRRFLALLAMLLLGSWTTLAAAESFTPAQRAEIVEILRNALKTDPGILRDAITALQDADGAQQQAAMRSAIAAAGNALTKTPGDPVEGNVRGDVTVVEFYDLRCPYCRRMLPVAAELLRRDGNVRIVYKDIPILGPASMLGARAVLAAQKQGGYLKLRTALMSGPADITTDTLRAAAERTGLDWDKLQKDMTDPAVQARIDANLTLARRLGIQGTPAYVIGDRMMPGAVELADLQSAIAATRQGQKQ
ncbi:DsbA family protein [Rhodovastum atsumiense]|uniref:DsbA family protein n=1 Tax=Rhodovastum atsumiense TaxID=504468 RepID=A0A5M6IRV3_9PROT|nr:DsbA family protein [Rhodovastum atsumiense]KAA5611004.1 DsbA family protein [Rhodovastum atsumiense]CAH2600215.1 DsbA family protein [Rhodovastum atsumiense]